jgi:hypothetical protein
MAIEEGGRKVIETTVCLDVQISMLGLERRVESEDVTAKDADKKRLRVTKLIIESDTIKSMQKLRSRLAADLKEIKVPTKMYRHGIYLIPQIYVVNVENLLKLAKKEMKELATQLVSEYDDLKAAAKESLGQLYDEKDYPSPEALPALFDVQWDYLAFDTPAVLKNLDYELFQSQRERAERRWDEAAEQIRRALREGFGGLVTEFVDKMIPGDDGTFRKLKQPFIDKFHEFLRFFEGRNVTSDEELDELVKKAKDLLEGRTAQELRGDEEMREKILESFKTLRESSDKLVQEYVREVSLEEDAA